jgi:hypothetical protein
MSIRVEPKTPPQPVAEFARRGRLFPVRPGSACSLPIAQNVAMRIAGTQCPAVAFANVTVQWQLMKKLPANVAGNFLRQCRMRYSSSRSRWTTIHFDGRGMKVLAAA